MRTFLAGLLVAMVTLAAGAQPPAPGVAKARTEYEAAVAKAQAEYQAVALKANAALRARLTTIQTELTKAGDLDTALGVRNLMKELDDTGLAPPPRSKEVVAREQFAAALSKVEWLGTTQPSWGAGKDKVVFATDGFVYVPPGNKLNASWVVLAPGTVVTVKTDGWVDVFTIDLAKGTLKSRTPGNLNSPAGTWNATRAK
jgi:hypothetical protein